jgi:hypothetical protein
MVKYKFPGGKKQLKVHLQVHYSFSPTCAVKTAINNSWCGWDLYNAEKIRKFFSGQFIDIL